MNEVEGTKRKVDAGAVAVCELARDPANREVGGKFDLGLAVGPSRSWAGSWSGLIDGASEDTVESEHERPWSLFCRGILRPVSSAYGHGVVQIIFEWLHAYTEMSLWHIVKLVEVDFTTSNIVQVRE
jgi:hypothetical protein